MTVDLKSQDRASAEGAIRSRRATISITGKVQLSVGKDLEMVLRKIEYWHQGSISAFKIMYRDEQGIWDGVNWDGLRASFFALRETDENTAWEKLREARTR